MKGVLKIKANGYNMIETEPTLNIPKQVSQRDDIKKEKGQSLNTDF